MFLVKQLNGLCSRNPALIKTPWDTYIYNMNHIYNKRFLQVLYNVCTRLWTDWSRKYGGLEMFSNCNISMSLCNWWCSRCRRMQELRRYVREWLAYGMV